MQVDGDTILDFIDKIEEAMTKAGRGRHRAFELMAELRAIGLKLTVCEPKPRTRTQPELVEDMAA